MCSFVKVVVVAVVAVEALVGLLIQSGQVQIPTVLLSLCVTYGRLC